MSQKRPGKGGTKYPFRNEATGKVRWFSFEKMMEADCMGVVRGADGVSWRRTRDLEPRQQKKRAEAKAGNVEIISDSLGFCQNQVAEMEADRRANGFSNIEFVEDPTVPRFFQVKCSSRSAMLKYAKHRGFVDRSSVNGSSAMLTAGDLARASKRVLDRYPLAAA